jgi:hypothetical protein
MQRSPSSSPTSSPRTLVHLPREPVLPTATAALDAGQRDDRKHAAGAAPPTRRVAMHPTIAFDPQLQRLPRPSFALYRAMCREDAHYGGGVRRMTLQKLGDGMTNASAASLATTLAGGSPALGISVFSVVSAVETGIAIFTNARQAYALDEAEGFRTHGIPVPATQQQAHGRSLATSGAIDALSSLLVVAGFLGGEELGPWFIFAMLTAYKLVQANNSMAEVGQWRCRIRSSNEPRTQAMLAHQQRYIDAVEMGLTTGTFSAATMGIFIALEMVRGVPDPGFKWLALAVALAGGLLSAGAKLSFGAAAVD